MEHALHDLSVDRDGVLCWKEKFEGKCRGRVFFNGRGD